MGLGATTARFGRFAISSKTSPVKPQQSTDDANSRGVGKPEVNHLSRFENRLPRPDHLI